MEGKRTSRKLRLALIDSLLYDMKDMTSAGELIQTKGREAWRFKMAGHIKKKKLMDTRDFLSFKICSKYEFYHMHTPHKRDNGCSE